MGKASLEHHLKNDHNFLKKKISWHFLSRYYSNRPHMWVMSSWLSWNDKHFLVYLPVYFQASKTVSPILSGVDLFGISFSIPLAAVATGVSVQVFKLYRPQHYLGWALMIAGFGLLSTLKANSSAAKYISYQVVLGLGMGNLWVATQFPILAPLPFSNNAHALGFFTFVRCFAQVSQFFLSLLASQWRFVPFFRLGAR